MPGFNTKALHSAHQEQDFFGSTQVPIVQTSAFAQESAEDLEKIFAGVKPGFAYSRLGNPTVNNFERRMAALEGGISATATASGSAAVALSLLNVLSSGDEVIAPTGLYGGTFDFFRELAPLKITVTYLDDFTAENVEAAIGEKTRVIFGEVIGNPKLNVLDIPTLAEVAHRHDLPLFVDNTTATPYLCNPLKLGADVVIHSTSKYVNSNGSAISGVIVDGGSFLWNEEKYPALAEYVKFRKGAFTARLRNATWRNFGATCAPLSAFLNINGLETLGLRMERISENALTLAEFFRERADVLEVNYPGLSESPYRTIVEEQLYRGYAGGILTIRVGSKARAFAVMNALKYAMKVSNVGDTKTLVLHTASTIFAHSSPEFRERAGVYEDLVRISVGIEDVEDLVADFAAALDANPLQETT
ncbi:MAG: O-acetylhomoserine aminocarboxypropyltransferase/cysteine synthase [Clostridia bacterium]|nr:O-acetylhomoserine aminocarboxypropyltransferase/cysteine synthase [Clostridia bacterium]